MKKLLLLAGIVPLFSYGADWRFVVSGAKELEYHYIDISKIDTSSHVRHFWTYVVNAEPDINRLKSTKNELNVNCKAQTYSLIQVVDYNDDGIVINSASYKELWKSPIPETIAEAWIEFACGSRKSMAAGERIIDPISEVALLTLRKKGRGGVDDTADQMIKRADAPIKPTKPCSFDALGIAHCD